MENKIPTAEELLNDRVYITQDGIEDVHDSLSTVADVMIQFAKLHVEAALEAACKNSKLLVINTEEHREIEDNKDLLDEYECGSDVIHISASSILNAYPLTLIK